MRLLICLLIHLMPIVILLPNATSQQTVFIAETIMADNTNNLIDVTYIIIAGIDHMMY